jgi:pyruvate/2-oxoglutarate dehydrogenase complex dihydrolipoamide acyltransferase (E2) component
MTRTKKISFGLLAIVCLIFAGCVGGEPESRPPAPKPQATQPKPVATEAQPKPAPQPAVKAPAPVQQSQNPVEKKKPEPSQLVEKEDAGQTHAARAGDGVKGSGYGGGIVTEPVSVYFKSQQMMTFKIKIPHALKLFKATNNRYPKDIKEYEREILKPNFIKLPELPEGRVYSYDPKTGELLVGQKTK